MKTKILFCLLTGCILALAAWLAHVPSSAQAEVPEKYRATVHKGLEYLVKNQHKDGHWEGDGGQHPVAMTGLAGIALLMEGSVVHNGKYSANLRKAVDWLMDKSQGHDGLIFSGHPSETARYMYGHGLATQFLAWAYGDEIDDVRRAKLKEIISRAVKYIISAQSTQGGWYHTSKVEGHDFAVISATAIQLQALYIAGNLENPVPRTVVNDGQEYLKMALSKYGQGAGSAPNRSQAVETAAALACRGSPDAFDLNDELCKKWLKYCRAEIPVGGALQFGRDELAHYYYAQVVYAHMLDGGSAADSWSGYRTAMFDHLQSSQNKDGSWPAPLGSEGISVGPVYAAAVWCTVLQLDKGNHPLTRRRQQSIF